jgi:hypothetical protein
MRRWVLVIGVVVVILVVWMAFFTDPGIMPWDVEPGLR